MSHLSYLLYSKLLSVLGIYPENYATPPSSRLYNNSVLEPNNFRARYYIVEELIYKISSLLIKALQY
jgi:hypothetical protein